MIKLIALALASMVCISPLAHNQEVSPCSSRAESSVPAKAPVPFAFVDGTLVACYVQGLGLVEFTSCVPWALESFAMPAGQVLEVTWVDSKGRTIVVRTFCSDYAGNMVLCVKAQAEAVAEMEKSFPPKQTETK